MDISLLILLCLVAVLSVYFVKWFAKVFTFHLKCSKLPLYKGAVPYLGHLNLFFGEPGVFWTSFKDASNDAAKEGGLKRIKMGPIHEVIVSDPVLAYNVLSCSHTKPYFYKFASCWLGNGLIQAPADLWKVHRKMINPTFSQHVLNGFLGVFNAQSLCLVEEFKSRSGTGLFDPRRKLSELTFKSVCQTVLGISTKDNNLVNEEYFNAVEKIFHIICIRLIKIHQHLPLIFATTSLKREQDKCVKILHNTSRTMMLKRKKERDNGDIRDDAYLANRFTASLDLLLGMAEKGQMDLEQVRMELDTFIAAGYDTSNRAVLFTLIYIGSFPEVQKKLYEEVMSVLGTKDFVDKDDLPKLVYTEAVIKESMRMSPVVPMVGRELDRDIEYNGQVLPKGMSALISVWGIHHNRNLWGPDVEEFKPERWFNPDCLPKNTNSFCPFSMGKRNCIGQRYAYMSMKVTISHIIRNYKISADYTKLRTNFDVLLLALEGYEISLQLR